MEEQRYTIVISLFDHNSALSRPRPTSSLLPNTATALPQATENALRVQAQAGKLVLPYNFWSLPASSPLPTVAAAQRQSPPTSPQQEQSGSGRFGARTTNSSTATNAGISSENRGTHTPAIRTSELYVPSREQQVVEKPVAQLDYRFGPLFVDWIDHPTVMTPPADSPTPSTSTLPPSTTPASQEQSGSTALNWGIIHLYREAGATPSTPAEKQRAEEEDDGTIVAVILVPGNLTVANFLSFISPALDAVMQLRMLRDSSPNRNLVLIRFRSKGEADQFRRMFMGKAFDESKDVGRFCPQLFDTLLKWVGGTERIMPSGPHSIGQAQIVLDSAFQFPLHDRQRLLERRDRATELSDLS